jgi:hypothetical protein
MRSICRCINWSLFVLLVAPGIAVGQAAQPTSTLVVNGQTGKAGVVQQNGRTYVDVEALAQIANGSLSFSPDRIVLTIPPLTSAGTSAAPATAPAANDSALSQPFMKAGIEEIGLLREWASPLANAIQNGYPLTGQWVASYQQKAAQGLQMASIAASTSADKNALQLLTTEFDGVRAWSDHLVEASKNMNTAQYSMSPGSVRDTPQAQKLITCWRFLGSMLAGGTFQDDDSCH